MSVTRQHGHRAEATHIRECTLAILGAPPPFWTDGPQRHVGKHDHWRARGAASQVVLEPAELLVAEIAHSTGREVCHIDEADEMDTVLIEAVPAGAVCAFAKTCEELLAVALIEHVVLARDVEDQQTRLAHDLRGVIELLRLREVADVARVDG